jgi:hypothetical protein
MRTKYKRNAECGLGELQNFAYKLLCVCVCVCVLQFTNIMSIQKLTLRLKCDTQWGSAL